MKLEGPLAQVSEMGLPHEGHVELDDTSRVLSNPERMTGSRIPSFQPNVVYVDSHSSACKTSACILTLWCRAPPRWTVSKTHSSPHWDTLYIHSHPLSSHRHHHWPR